MNQKTVQVTENRTKKKKKKKKKNWKKLEKSMTKTESEERPQHEQISPKRARERRLFPALARKESETTRTGLEDGGVVVARRLARVRCQQSGHQCRVAAAGSGQQASRCCAPLRFGRLVGAAPRVDAHVLVALCVRVVGGGSRRAAQHDALVVTHTCRLL
jgi:hypothetical protein